MRTFCPLHLLDLPPGRRTLPSREELPRGFGLRWLEVLRTSNYQSGVFVTELVSPSDAGVKQPLRPAAAPPHRVEKFRKKTFPGLSRQLLNTSRLPAATWSSAMDTSRLISTKMKDTANLPPSQRAIQAAARSYLQGGVGGGGGKKIYVEIIPTRQQTRHKLKKKQKKVKKKTIIKHSFRLDIFGFSVFI